LAYDHHDLDDGLKSGLLTEEQLMAVPGFRRSHEAVLARQPDLSDEGALRSSVVRSMIDGAVGDVLRESGSRLASHSPRSVDDVRGAPRRLVSFSEGAARERAGLQAFLQANLYGHYRVRRMQEKAKRFLEELFREYVAHPEQLPPSYHARIESVGVKQGVADYIAGMTDRYAQDEYRRLFLPFERV
ncbi:MAG: deoxyguanosinetriphosphate triphosphohydrolase, partial [Planctomycetes bacterium]|nr:deoxyguanosinetriphosphate triphosphohydrolase [Planctomycetota bacterium]